MLRYYPTRFALHVGFFFFEGVMPRKPMKFFVRSAKFQEAADADFQRASRLLLRGSETESTQRMGDEKNEKQPRWKPDD